jgi:hypothetical protein
MPRPKDRLPEDQYPLVICPRCKGRYHRVNDLYDPERVTKGHMLVLLPKYKAMSWGSFPETEDSFANRLTCPSCGGRYGDESGKVTIDGPLPPPPLVTEPEEPEPYEAAPVLFPEGSLKIPVKESPKPESKPEPRPEPKAEARSVSQKKHGQRQNIFEPFSR